MLHDRREDAEKSLAFLRGDSLEPEFLQEELIEIVRGVEEEKANASSSSFVDMFRGTNLRRTMLCVAVALSRASSGVWVFLSYGVSTLFSGASAARLTLRPGILLPAGWGRRHLYDQHLLHGRAARRRRGRLILRV